MNSLPLPISRPVVTRGVVGLSLAALLVLGCGERRAAAPSAADGAASQLSSPAPVSTPPTISVLPTPQDSSVSWAELTAIVRAQPDSVRAVMQTHARKVTATFLDGHRFHTTEPAIDAIVTLLRQVDPAGHILIATE